MTTELISDFLKTHSIKKDNTTTINKEITNTRIGDKTLNIYGGSYHIPDDEYDTFLKIYYNDIVAKQGVEYLTEKQLPDEGPILIDIDLRYKYEVNEKQHTKEHVFDLLCLYLEQLKKIFQFEKNTEFPIFVFEKTKVNNIEKKNITKDGIHIIIGLKTNHTIQCILRKKMMEEMPSLWNDLPIINTWDEVFDEGISKGTTNWQLFGSRKPNHETYLLKYAYSIKIDPTDGELIMDEDEVVKYQNEESMCLMSARYRHHPSLLIMDSFINEHGNVCGGNKQKQKYSSTSQNMMVSASATELDMNGFQHALFNVRSKEELNVLVNYFLEQITFSDYELKEAYEYAMSLPNTYYNTGSYEKWIRVGWALKNISNKLFIVWVVFSAQTDRFDYYSIQDLWSKWMKFDCKNPNGLTKRSIMYWSKQDAKDKFIEIQKRSIDFHIEKIIENIKDINSFSESKSIRGYSDFDIANVLYQIHKDEYVCVSVKDNVWYKFNDHKWSLIDSGTTLRKSISITLRDLFQKKLNALSAKIRLIEDTECVEYKYVKREQKYICDIIEKLGNTKYKTNIMTEAKEIFYDEKFLKRLDENPYLLCFSNGVIDFKEKTFRKGHSDDYITKSTNINYIDYKKPEHAQTVNEINDFMQKLFPNPELHKYMWEHLASTLIGTCVCQTFNMYIGVGQNGKSMLVTLMEQALGDYTGGVALNLITSKRPPVGGTSTELVGLKGIRYAVMQEPSKGEKINEGIMKQLTGGDPVQGRGLYKSEMTNYIPQFKLVVCSNEFMEIKSTVHGTWRRIRVVDFESLFTENPVKNDPEKPHQFLVDKYIKEKFNVWKEVFASMLVKIAYEKNGMVEDCAKVMASSNSYRQQQDYVSEFIFEKTEKCLKNSCIHKNTLHNLFKEWYNVNYSGKLANMKELDATMEKTYGKNKCGVWVGVKIKVYNENVIEYDNDDKTENDSGEDMDILLEEL